MAGKDHISSALVEQLDTGNYAVWSMRMRMLLKHRELWAAVEANGAVDVKLDEKALALIVLHVKDFHLAALRTVKTAKEAWIKLEEAYKADSTSRRLQLRRELNSLKKEGSESVAKYVGRARELGNALIAIGHEVKPEELVMSVLAGLPKEFDTVVSIMEMADQLAVLDVVLPKLLQVEQKLVSRSHATDDGAAFVGQYRPQDGGAFRADRDGRPQGDRANAASDRRCYYCGKKGHIKADCFQLKRDQGQGGAGSASSSVAGAGIALAANDALFDADTWVLDSGASQHMTPSRDHLLNYKPIEGRSVRFGDGQEAAALGVGDVQLIMDVHGDSVPVMFKDVLHVPGVVTNLVSVRRSVERGASVLFQDGNCIMTLDDMVVAVAKPLGGLYALSVFPDEQKDPAPTALVAATAQLWHARFGHLGYDSMMKLAASDMVTGFDVTAADIKRQQGVLCEACVMGKHSRDSFGDSTTQTSRRLELVHMDVLGPLEVKSLGGSRYVATFLDDFSGMSVVRPLEHKSDVPDVVKQVVQFLELQTGDKLLAVRTDRGGEYVNDELRAYFASKGVVHQTTAPYTPQQNGKAERLNRTLVERVRCMLYESDLPKSLWAEAIACANHVRNRSPTVAHVGKTPSELFWGGVPDVSHLRVFGSTAFVQVPKQLRKKLDATSRKGVFVGYEAASKAYRVLVEGKVVVSRDVKFVENLGSAEALTDAGPDLHLLDLDDVVVPIPEAVDGPPQEPAEEFHGAAEQPEEPQQAPAEPRYPARVRAKPASWWQASANVAADAAAGGKAEPQTFEEAVSGVDGELWRQAMDEEMSSLHENETWEMVDLPAYAKAIPVRWVYKIKRDAAGNVERYKARLVVKGYMQREGVDFTEVYAPVSKHTSLRALLSLVAAENLELHQLDVKTAFLNGELEEELYVVQPPGYELGGKGIACRLKKALYGLRQAPRAWYTRLSAELALHDFLPSVSDPGLYVRHDKGGSTYLLVWVDDILVAGSPESVQGVKDVLHASFDVRDLGEANFFLGMEVERDRGSNCLKLTQKKYTAELLLRYGLQDANSKRVPLSPAVKLSREGSDKLDTALFGYGELIGSLLYLSVCTRPDITFAVGALARYMSDPREMHWEAAKGVLRYLCGTAKHGLVFGGKSALVGWCDADYAGDVDTRRSTTGYVFVLNGGAISWASKLQPTVAVSTAEAEYMAAAAAVKEALWLRKLLADLQMPVGTVQMHCDNQAALSLLKHPIASARSKHIDVLHHFARERVARGEVKFEYCQSSDMLADCLTKALPDVSFMFCRDTIGVRNSL